MGRYMMGRQCVREQGNIKNEKRQGREEDGPNEKKVSKTSTIQTITRSTGENERPAQAEKSTALITPGRAHLRSSLTRNAPVASGTAMS